MTLDLDQLEALAKAAQANSDNIGEQDWYEADEISSLMYGLIAKADAGLMAGCTPPVILALIAEVRALREAIKHQANAARAGMDAAKRASTIQLELAEQARAESSPDALASERAMNAMLTEENEALREDAAMFRLLTSTCYALDANSFDASNQPGTIRITLKHKTRTYPELEMKIIDFLLGYKARVEAATKEPT